jgi:hypothetical protein
MIHKFKNHSQVNYLCIFLKTIGTIKLLHAILHDAMHEMMKIHIFN